MASEGSRPLLMIPGPLEFEDEVLAAMGTRGTSHVDPTFIEKFGSCLEMLRAVFLCGDGQPFIVAGSGTLGWDMVASNLVEPGEHALVINTGYFGDSFADCLTTYGASVTHLRPHVVGGAPTLAELEAALTSAGKAFKVVVVTHVDTSTGVLTDVKGIAETVRRCCPEALVVVDGVCATGGEELRQSDWGVDVAITASQKCFGVPPGLCLVMASKRAIATLEARTQPVTSYYASWQRWLPIMQAYEARRPSYFATPAVSHVLALHTSLSKLLREETGGVEGAFARHRAVATAIKRAVHALGMSTVPQSSDLEAHTLTTVRYPPGVTAEQLLPAAKKHGVILAGGLHRDIKAQYFRIGHMASASTASLAHAEQVAAALEAALRDCGVSVEPGVAVAAVRSVAFPTHP